MHTHIERERGINIPRAKRTRSKAMGDDGRSEAPPPPPPPQKVALQTSYSCCTALVDIARILPNPTPNKSKHF
jgi:hypothetical protein